VIFAIAVSFDRFGAAGCLESGTTPTLGIWEHARCFQVARPAGRGWQPGRD
jgi:hypothetical protein